MQVSVGAPGSLEGEICSHEAGLAIIQSAPGMNIKSPWKVESSVKLLPLNSLINPTRA